MSIFTHLHLAVHLSSQWLGFINVLFISEFIKVFWFRIFFQNCNEVFLGVFEPVNICDLSKFESIWGWGPNLYDNLWTGINLFFFFFCPVINCIHNSFKSIEVKYCIKYSTKTSKLLHHLRVERYVFFRLN